MEYLRLGHVADDIAPRLVRIGAGKIFIAPLDPHPDALIFSQQLVRALNDFF